MAEGGGVGGVGGILIKTGFFHQMHVSCKRLSLCTRCAGVSTCGKCNVQTSKIVQHIKTFHPVSTAEQLHADLKDE